MDIQHEGNSVMEMLNSIAGRVRKSFSRFQPDRSLDLNLLNSQCSCFEDAIPFWSVLCAFFYEYDERKYAECAPGIDSMMTTLLTDFDTENMAVLTAIRDSVELGEQFNTDLHHGVRRTYTMWSIQMPNKKAGEAALQRRANLQQWYMSYLFAACDSILKSPDPGMKLTAFLLDLLDAADLFDADTYKQLVIRPIYKIYDSFHESALMSNGVDLVEAIQVLSNLTKMNLDGLIQRFNSLVNGERIDPMTHELKGVGEELRRMMMEKLLRNLIVDLNKAIYDGFFSANIDWNAAEIPVQADGFSGFVINRCVDCRCAWGELYWELRPRIIEHISNSILYIVTRLDKVSAAGYLRMDVNVQLLKHALGKEPAETWGIIDDLILKLCGTAPRGARARALAEVEKIADTMKLQLRALLAERAPGKH
jgi:hypothetical protein